MMHNLVRSTLLLFSLVCLASTEIPDTLNGITYPSRNIDFRRSILDSGKSAGELVEQAIKMWGQQDTQGAVFHLDCALVLEPRVPYYLALRATLSFEIEKGIPSIILFRRLLIEHFQSVFLHSNYGVFLGELYFPWAAVSSLETAETVWRDLRRLDIYCMPGESRKDCDERVEKEKHEIIEGLSENRAAVELCESEVPIPATPSSHDTDISSLCRKFWEPAILHVRLHDAGLMSNLNKVVMWLWAAEKYPQLAIRVDAEWIPEFEKGGDLQEFTYASNPTA
eukprot:Rmarinus@m.7755